MVPLYVLPAPVNMWRPMGSIEIEIIDGGRWEKVCLVASLNGLPRCLPLWQVGRVCLVA